MLLLLLPSCVANDDDEETQTEHMREGDITTIGDADRLPEQSFSYFIIISSFTFIDFGRAGV